MGCSLSGLGKQYPHYPPYPPVISCYGKYGFTGMHRHPFLIQSLQQLRGCKNGSLEWLQQSYVNYQLALYENFPSPLGVSFLRPTHLSPGGQLLAFQKD